MSERDIQYCRNCGTHLGVVGWWLQKIGLSPHQCRWQFKVRMEWLDGLWIDTKLMVHARTQASAAGRAIHQAQRGAEAGWHKVTVALEPADIVSVEFRAKARP